MGFRFSVNFLLLYYKKKKLSFLLCFYESSRLQCKEKGVVLIFIIRTRELKIGFFGRFIGEKSVFGRHGNDFNKIKSKKNRQKIQFFPGSKNMKKLLLKDFEPTQND